MPEMAITLENTRERAIPLAVLGRGKGNSAVVYLELYGGPGDGVKRRRSHFPVTLKFPDDFLVGSDFKKTVLYKRWSKVLTLIEDQLGKPRIVTAMLYYVDGSKPPEHRKKTYSNYIQRPK